MFWNNVRRLTLCGLLVLAFAGCGNSDTQAQTVTGVVDLPPVTENSDEDDSYVPENILEVDDPWLRLQHVTTYTGDLDGMVERGFIRLLVVPSKSYYFLDGARERGIAAAIRSEFETTLNNRLKKEKKSVEVVAIPVRRDQVIPLLLKGHGDVSVANWTVTEGRQKHVDFVEYDYKEVRELIVVPPGGPDLASVEELSGMEVYVRRSSSYHESLKILNKRFEAEDKPKVVIRLVEEHLNDGDLLEMVNANLLPATVIDSHKWEWLWIRAFPKLKVNGDVFIREKGAIGPMLRQDSPQLKGVLEDFTKSHPPGGKWFNQVFSQYYKKSRWITNATESAERKKFQALVGLFEKYAKQYEFDHLMLMAQGYQESRLDQSARSHVGAIGIMQLMPTTAAGFPLNMPNVDEVEPNIHAGVKYMRYVVDEYFDDPEIDDVNKLLFAFAAYNAGPNRVSRLRLKAGEGGLDQNQWFNNVERVVAAKVGREPVQYVRNIYKYYVAYNRVRGLEAERQAKGSR